MPSEHRRGVRAHARLLFVGLALIGNSAACTVGETTLAPQPPVLVIHAVLNPRAEDQLVLLHRAATGRTAAGPADRTDPFGSQNRRPVHGAEVTITTPSGRVLVAREDRVTRPDDTGEQGVYRIPHGWDFPEVVPGGTYTLRVRTVEGEVATGTTTVPEVVTPSDYGSLDTLWRDRDTLHLRWQRAPHGRRHEVRVWSPSGMYVAFADTGISLPGTLRHDLDGPPVFIGGDLAVVAVTAVDANYYDYYRTRGDPLTGTSLINRLTGAVGVFGSVVPVQLHYVRVRNGQ